jgi:thiopeptide-type bacteriocin biosynthesis protein
LAHPSLLAEISYRPERSRSANVAVRPAVHPHEIVLGVTSGVPTEHIIATDELLVGLNEGRLRVYCPSRETDITVVQGHMLTPHNAPPVARFLLDVATDGICEFRPFDWGSAATFPALPRVQVGRLVLSLAQWSVESLATTPGNDNIDALEQWRQRWDVPRHVYLTVRDNRLLLDLDDIEHRELLMNEVRQTPANASAIVQEALPGPDDAWLPGPDGAHIAEFAVPLSLTKTRTKPSTSTSGRSFAAFTRTSGVLASQRTRLRTPGSDWLYAKLYGTRSLDDELIAGPLRSFGEFATGAGLCDGWFFLRYADPDSHLRVRYHGDPQQLLGPLLTEFCAWASDLVHAEQRTGFAFDTYQREVERYGGAEGGIEAAEAIFVADSPAAAGLIDLSREPHSPDRTTLAVISVDDLLASLALEPAQRLQVYRTVATASREGGREYRDRQRDLRRHLSAIVDLERPEERALQVIFTARRRALEPVADTLTVLERAGSLRRPIQELCPSYIHLHLNRLIGADPGCERLVLELLLRTRQGLARSPIR